MKRKRNPPMLERLVAAGALVLLVACGKTSVGQQQLSSLTYVPDSTVKLEQLIGDWDQQFAQPTRNRTWSRFRLRGTDLGASFEHEGQLFFLFGDTLGVGGGDCLATSASTNPEQGLALDFLRRDPQHYLKIEPPGISMGGFEVPTGGISLQGDILLFCTTDHSSQHVMGRSVLVRFDPVSKRFATIRDISKRPANFINVTAHVATTDRNPHLPSLPDASPWVFLWGSGEYRKSHVYLACTPAENFVRGDRMFYFAGLDERGKPAWSAKELSAAPVVEHPVVGELSVCWCKHLRVWLMTYNSPRPRGIVLRWAPEPWGPWSHGIVIFNPWRDGGYGRFLRAAPPGGGSGPVGPVIAPATEPSSIWGGEYGPYLIERFLRLAQSDLTLYYVMSTWNPYTVVLMKSRLKAEF